MHLRSFFDLWDAFVLQAVQTDQPNISDHLMFEVREALSSRSVFVYRAYSQCWNVNAGVVEFV